MPAVLRLPLLQTVDERAADADVSRPVGARRPGGVMASCSFADGHEVICMPSFGAAARPCPALGGLASATRRTCRPGRAPSGAGSTIRRSSGCSACGARSTNSRWQYASTVSRARARCSGLKDLHRVEPVSDVARTGCPVAPSRAERQRGRRGS
jgi:hypothetical protein